MKPIIPFALLGALLAVGTASAATTTPVGYITVNIAANGATYVSPSLVEATTFAGASSTAPTGTTINFSGSVPTGLNSGYVLEITSGANEGWWSTVISSTATSITINDTLPAGLAIGTPVSVRKHSTLKSFLGLNAPGLKNFDGVSTSDEVQILNAQSQVVASYAWVTAADLGQPEGAWINLATSNIADDTIIEPGTAIKIKHVVNTALSFTATGTVKVTKTQVDLFPKFNWVGTPAAAGSTLNGQTYQNQLTQYDGVSPNYDELQILRPNQTISAFAAADLGSGPTMFNLASSEDAGTEPVKEGTGQVIKRTGTPAGIITLPATTVGN